MDSISPSPSSHPSSPASEISHQNSEVPTEPITQSELRLFTEHLTRRKRFLSDYEQYNPVQNMQALANHVFDLTETVHHVSGEVTDSRRMIDLVRDNQREGNESLRLIGGEMERLGGHVGMLEKKVDMLEESTEVLRNDISELRGRVEENHRETQQGFAEIKSILMALVGGHGGLRV